MEPKHSACGKPTERSDLMEKTAFVLRETFCAEDEEQRKEAFRKEFTRYLLDTLAVDAAKPCG